MEEMLCAEIARFCASSLENRFPEGDLRYFDEPLVGFAAADDPLFHDYRQVIGPFHLTPRELLPEAQTVISWVLPVNRATSKDNSREELWPARSWALTRNNGEMFNVALRRHIVAFLEEKGARALAPQLSPQWQQVDDPRIGVASSWSERHAAYAAGLGTFSLNDALITARGIAHRLGSVVTDLVLSPTPRTAPDFRHNCLWFREGSCGACIGRCPAKALSNEGHDKKRCRAYVYGAVPKEVSERYGVAQTGCGLCQTRVPCEAVVPPGKNLKY